MLSRIVTAVVLLAVPMLALVSCGDDQQEHTRVYTSSSSATPTASSGPMAIAMPTLPPLSTPTTTYPPTPTPIPSPTPTPYHPTEGIAPCTPVQGSPIDPCDPDAPPFEGGTAQSAPELGDEPSGVRAMLEDGLSPPAWVTHVALRGTNLPGTVRCTAGDPFRPPSYLQDEFVSTGNSLSVKCYIDVRANAYVLGSGPSTLTAMVFRWIYWVHQLTPYLEEGQTEQDLIEARRQQFETELGDYFAGRERVLFLGPPADLSSEAWRSLGTWDVQRREGRHRDRRPSLQRPVAAHQAR